MALRLKAESPGGRGFSTNNSLITNNTSGFKPSDVIFLVVITHLSTPKPSISLTSSGEFYLLKLPSDIYGIV